MIVLPIDQPLTQICRTALGRPPVQVRRTGVADDAKTVSRSWSLTSSASIAADRAAEPTGWLPARCRAHSPASRRSSVPLSVIPPRASSALDRSGVARMLNGEGQAARYAGRRPVGVAIRSPAPRQLAILRFR